MFCSRNTRDSLVVENKFNKATFLIHTQISLKDAVNSTGTGYKLQFELTRSKWYRKLSKMRVSCISRIGDGMQRGIRVYGVPWGVEMINCAALFPSVS